MKGNPPIITRQSVTPDELKKAIKKATDIYTGDDSSTATDSKNDAKISEPSTQIISLQSSTHSDKKGGEASKDGRESSAEVIVRRPIGLRKRTEKRASKEASKEHSKTVS